MKIKTSELVGAQLDWAVAKVEGHIDDVHSVLYQATVADVADSDNWHPSEKWEQGGPIIESANITIIRADDTFEKDEHSSTGLKRIPTWFAKYDQWVGHSLYSSYEGENMEPSFIISEDGHYGPTPLIAAMRAYIAFKFGDEIEIPENLS